MKTKATLFGRLVRKYRIDHGKVLKDMANGIGVSTAHASALELGNKRISEDFVQKVGNFFELNSSQMEELRHAASISQPSVKMDVSDWEEFDRSMAVSFARKYQDLPNDRKVKLKELLEG